MHSCFTSSIFTARTLDFKVKFGFVFRSEAVVFRRYVLALLSVGLLRKFEAYLVYLSLIRSYFLRCFSVFQKFLNFTYMLLWFRLIIPSFPAQIDDMRSRFSALSLGTTWDKVPVLLPIVGPYLPWGLYFLSKGPHGGDVTEFKLCKLWAIIEVFVAPKQGRQLIKVRFIKVPMK